MFKLFAELKAKGGQAEAAFRAWLNQSSVVFLYVEQSPYRTSCTENQAVNRPDYLVSIPT